MTAGQAHITAGDLSPITMFNETDYATPTGQPAYYADIAEGGRFAMQDTPNPYLAFRYGSRSFDPDDYVKQQEDAQFTASMELRDLPGWEKVIEFATGTGGTQDYGSLPSRTEQIHVRTGASAWQGRRYVGCKTDALTIKADVPGGIVQFEETVLASYGEDIDTAEPLTVWSSSAPAIQWMNGATVNGVQVYPQSLSMSISNELGRKYAPKSGGAVTGGLLEGRRAITIEMDCWMEDLANIRGAINNTAPGDITFTLGISNPKTITLTGVRWMGDTTHPDLVQDKQRDTLRMRATGITIATPEA